MRKEPQPEQGAWETGTEAQLAEVWTYYRKEPARALPLVTRILSEARQRDSRLQTLRCLTLIAACHSATGATPEADTAAREAVALVPETDDTTAQGDAFYQWAQVALAQGDAHITLERSLRALYLRRQVNNPGKLAENLNLVGAACFESGDTSGAEKYWMEGLEVARSCNHESAETHILSNIAVIKHGAGHSEEAVSYFTECMERHEKKQDMVSLVRTLTNLAGTYSDLERFAEAEAVCDRALHILPTLDNNLVEPWTRVTQSGIYRRQGRLDEADAVLALGWAAAERAGTSRYVPLLLGEQGLVARGRKDYASAQDALEQSLELARVGNQRQHTVEILRYLAEIAEETGDMALALQRFKELHEISRKMEREAAERRVEANLVAERVKRAELQTQTARHEAELLRKHQEELEATNRELAAANEQNECLLARLREQARHLERLTVEDPLTGLFNRRYLSDYLERQIMQARAVGYPLSIAIIDLDNFKRINDTFSHAVGDIVLKTVARLLRESSRITDTAVRYGGEEFLLVLPGASVTDAANVLERFRSSLQAYPWHTERDSLSVTGSIGIATDSGAEELENLLARADHHLYRAKTSGKNRICH